MENKFFGENLQKKVYNRKSEHHHRTSGIKFQLTLIILNFWTKLIQIGYFRSKKQKNDNHHRILHIPINPCSKFQLQQTILIFWNRFHQKRLLPVENRKN